MISELYQSMTDRRESASRPTSSSRREESTPRSGKTPLSRKSVAMLTEHERLAVFARKTVFAMSRTRTRDLAQDARKKDDAVDIDAVEFPRDLRSGASGPAASRYLSEGQEAERKISATITRPLSGSDQRHGQRFGAAHVVALGETERSCRARGVPRDTTTRRPHPRYIVTSTEAARAQGHALADLPLLLMKLFEMEVRYLLWYGGDQTWAGILRSLKTQSLQTRTSIRWGAWWDEGIARCMP